MINQITFSDNIAIAMKTRCGRKAIITHDLRSLNKMLSRNEALNLDYPLQGFVMKRIGVNEQGEEEFLTEFTGWTLEGEAHNRQIYNDQHDLVGFWTND